MPYDTRLSKNVMWAPRIVKGRFLGMYLRHADLIHTYELPARLGLKRFICNPEQKVNVDILVVRPDMRADPANFIDAILDIVKRVIEIDDRWFAVSLDWLLDKPTARIEVTVRQNL